MSKIPKYSSLLLSLILFVGCSENANEVINGKIRILYWGDRTFTNDYGSILASKFPELNYEVVAMNDVQNESDLLTIIKNTKPDLLFMRSYEEYLQFVDDGLLEEIDTKIIRDDYDINKFQPSVIKMLRNNGENKVYGLSPTFSSQVLYYNKDLFNRFKVDEPTDQMTWDEVLLTASRFQSRDGVSGFSALYSVYDLVENIGKTIGLRIISENNKKIEILTDSQEWIEIFNQINSAIQAGSIALPGSTIITKEMTETELFLQGKSAMTVDNVSLLHRYETQKKQFNLGIVTVPIDHLLPDSTFSIRTDNLFGINVASNLKEEAWEILKLINSDEVARIRAQYDYTLSSRTKYSNDLNGISLEPFNKLTYDNRVFKFPDVSMQFRVQFYQMMSEELNKLFSNKQSSADTLKNIRDKGDVLLAAEKSSTG